MKKTAGILLLIFTLIGVAPATNSFAEFEYDQFITDENTKQNVLKVVQDYIAENIKKNNSLVVKDDVSSMMRSYQVIQVFDVVSRKSDIYTVQVDVDEIDGEPRWLLFFDVQNIKGTLEVIGVRNGGRHLRQSSST